MAFSTLVCCQDTYSREDVEGVKGVRAKASRVGRYGRDSGLWRAGCVGEGES
jgi:hypothetical protein